MPGGPQQFQLSHILRVVCYSTPCVAKRVTMSFLSLTSKILSYGHWRTSRACRNGTRAECGLHCKQVTCQLHVVPSLGLCQSAISRLWPQKALECEGINFLASIKRISLEGRRSWVQGLHCTRVQALGDNRCIGCNYGT